MLSESLNQGNPQAINYFIAQKYVEALGKFATAENQKTLILPMELSNIASTIGGIAEIAKDVANKNKIG